MIFVFSKVQISTAKLLKKPTLAGVFQLIFGNF